MRLCVQSDLYMCVCVCSKGVVRVFSVAHAVVDLSPFVAWPLMDAALGFAVNSASPLPSAVAVAVACCCS